MIVCRLSRRWHVRILLLRLSRVHRLLVTVVVCGNWLSHGVAWVLVVGNRNMMSTVMHWYLVVDVCSVNWHSSVCVFV